MDLLSKKIAIWRKELKHLKEKWIFLVCASQESRSRSIKIWNDIYQLCSLLLSFCYLLNYKWLDYEEESLLSNFTNQKEACFSFTQGPSSSCPSWKNHFRRLPSWNLQYFPLLQPTQPVSPPHWPILSPPPLSVVLFHPSSLSQNHPHWQASQSISLSCCFKALSPDLNYTSRTRNHMKYFLSTLGLGIDPEDKCSLACLRTLMPCNSSDILRIRWASCGTEFILELSSFSPLFSDIFTSYCLPLYLQMYPDALPRQVSLSQID